jgi:hypothetical protein
VTFEMTTTGWRKRYSTQPVRRAERAGEFGNDDEGRNGPVGFSTRTIRAPKGTDQRCCQRAGPKELVTHEMTKTGRAKDFRCRMEGKELVAHNNECGAEGRPGGLLAAAIAGNGAST